MNKYLHCIMLFVFPVYLYAQPTFKKSFGLPAYNDLESGVIQLKSKEFIVTGSTSQPGAGNYDAYCIKLDENGNTLWGKTYGTPINNSHVISVATSDGGFVMCFGSYASYYNTILFIVKCDKDGNILWSKCLQSTKQLTPVLDIVPSFIYQSKSGDIYVLSDWSGVDASLADFSLLKLDAKGNYQWNTPVTQDYFFGYYYNCAGLTGTDDGDIVVVENGSGDDFYQFGSYTRIFHFSGETGDLKQNKSIDQGYKNGFSYLQAYGVASKNNKVFIEASYQRGDDAGTCWFAVGSNNKNVEAIFDNNGTGKGKVLNQQKDTLFYQLKQALQPKPLKTKDGGQLSAYSAYSTNYDIVLNKYDSLGRICPDYVLPTTDSANLQKTFFYTYGDYFTITQDTFALVDSAVVVTNLLSETIICSGSAPDSLADKSVGFPASLPNIGESAIVLYPNPATDYISLSFSVQHPGKLFIDIVSMDGKTMKNTTLIICKGNNRTTLSLQNLPAGMYYANIRGLGKPQKLKFFKSN